MILEHALLDVAPERQIAYEAALAEALPLISATPGFVRLEVRKGIERPGQYLLLVEWETLEAHETGFRGSERYERWRALLHPFYAPMPEVTHFGAPVASA